MISKRLSCAGICLPTELLFNAKNEFVGYLMPQAQGRELSRGLFIKPLFEKYFPDWTKRETVALCVTILQKIKYLHERNVILGDINGANILVVSPTEVYFVDTDSYQVGEFPCPVGTPAFTAPEIQGQGFGDFLRTFAHENFALATLLFMIMLPGKLPYAQQGGEGITANIKAMDFSYPLGENKNGKAPEGVWRFMWSHMTWKLKNAFYKTFKGGEEYATPATRLDAQRWLGLFVNYLNLIESGKFAEQDEMSLDIFPTRTKKNPNWDYAHCRICGVEQPVQFMKSGCCNECFFGGEVYACNICGGDVIFTKYRKLIAKKARPTTCLECLKAKQAARKEIVETRYCNGCGNPFEIERGEYEFFVSKGLELPKKCEQCRANKNQ